MKLSTERRDQLFRLAGEEFAAHGFTGASLNRTIAAMGMSKSSFYHYFTNKTDLFEQMLEHTLAPLFDMMVNFDPAELSAETYWPFLQAMGADQMRLANESPDLVSFGRMFYRSLEDPQERALIEPLMSGTTKWLTGLIRRGQTLGMVREDLPETLLIDMLFGLGIAIDRWVLTHWDELSKDERTAFGQTSVELFKRLLEPPSPARPGTGGSGDIFPAEADLKD